MTTSNESEPISTIQHIEFPDLEGQTASSGAALAANIALLHGVKVKVQAVVGEIHATLGELLGLQEASVLKIEKPVDSPIDILVDGNVVARGELIAVGDNFGVRITEIAPVKKS